MKIIIDGATGRLGTTQHLKALLAIRAEGGLALKNGERLMPEPVLLGRNPDKLATLAAAHGGLSWSDDVPAALADPTIDIYFDVAATGGRLERALRAIAAGKHIYLEKQTVNTFFHYYRRIEIAHGRFTYSINRVYDLKSPFRLLAA